MNEIVYAGKHPVTYSVTRHSHSSWELIYWTGGEGCFAFDGFSLPYREGDMVIIPPFIVHSNVGTKGFTNIHLNIADPTLNLKEPTLIRDDSNHFIRDAFNAAFYHFSLAPGKPSVLLSSYANLIICQILANQDAPQRTPLVEEITGCIIRNYPDENFELDVFLHQLPFNYDYIRKLFKKEIGVTPHQYLSDIRLQTAAENLVISDGQGVSVSEIARICGFKEPLYFSRMFKKKYGLSPSQYQAHARQDQRVLPDAQSIKILSKDA